MNTKWADRRNFPWSERFDSLASQTKDSRLRKFYEAGVVAGDTPISEVPMVAMDLETTGLDPQRDGIVSIGVIPMSYERIWCNESRHWIVKPREDLNADSVKVHGITHSKIESAPDLMSIVDELLEVLAGKIVVVHYRYIERHFLNAALRARLGEGIEFPTIDTMELEVRLWRKNTSSVLQRMLGRPTVSLRLADSRTRYNLPFYSPHDALTDALASGELLIAQLLSQYSPSVPVKKLWG